MFSRYWNRLALLGGTTAALLGLAATPASASSANPCPDGSNPYFSTPNIYLSEPNVGTPQAGGVWSDTVTVRSFCWDGRNGDVSTPLAGVAVTGVTVSSTGAVPGLVARIEGTGDWQSLPLMGNGLGVTLPTPAGVTTDSQGQASFKFEATTLNTDHTVNKDTYLALPNGGTSWVGLDLELGTGMGSADNGPMGPEPLGGGLVFAQTPELDSLALFGSGIAGLASYALMRVRARQRN